MKIQIKWHNLMIMMCFNRMAKLGRLKIKKESLKELKNNANLKEILI
jgi:hypothetical protein